MSDGSERAVPSDGVRVLCGDMRQVLATLPAESVHAIVTDPPYGLEFMGKGWDESVPGPDYWRACLRVAKPGAHLLAFGGTRTAHRLACAIEDAGWELRDCLCWLYGSGFPKSHDISKAIDREHGAVRTEVIRPGVRSGCAPDMNTYGSGLNAGFQTRELTAPATEAARAWQGWGTALKPAYEPVYLARKPFKGSVAGCVQEHGCGALNVDGCRIGTTVETWPASRSYRPGSFQPTHDGTDPTQCTGEAPPGRWPANLVLDEAAAQLLDAEVGELTTGGGERGVRDGAGCTGFGRMRAQAGRVYEANSGGPSRFYYTSKASRTEREAGLERFESRNVNDGRDTSIDNPYQRGDTQRRNVHPTVKPVSLMRWLVRLITPPGGTVLDPFTGSGSTGVAAVLEGARFVGVELSAEYAQLATARIAHAADEDDGPQLTLFERQEVARPAPRQASLFGDDEP